MQLMHTMRRTRTLLALAGFSLAATGCGGVSLWPFGDDAIDKREQSRTPSNATEYRCDGNRRFFVRTLDANAVWVILPDREVRLVRDSGSAYGAGKTRLLMEGTSATLADPPNNWTGCTSAKPAQGAG